MNDNSKYVPLISAELEFLQSARDQILDRIIFTGGNVVEAKEDLFKTAAFDLKLGWLPIENRGESEAFAILLGDWLISFNKRTGSVQWSVQSQSQNRSIVLRGMKNGRAITISSLADYLQKEINLSYFRFRLDGYLTGVIELDDPLPCIEDIKCRCGHLCRSDSFRPGPVKCDRCKLKWITTCSDKVSHNESEIGGTDIYEVKMGGLAIIKYPEDMNCCTVCGQVYDPKVYDACPGLFLLAITMLEDNEENRAFPLNKQKALEFLFANKSKLQTFWTEKKSTFGKRWLSETELALDRVGLLSEIQ